MIRNLGNKIVGLLTKNQKLKKLHELELKCLPSGIVTAANFLIINKTIPQLTETINIIEARRKEIAAEGDKKIPIWYSPKPNSSDNCKTDGNRPEPGKTLYFTMEQIAKTGKKQKWATALLLLTKELKASTGIELGACAGLSARYIASADSMKDLITVEGSEELSKIATQTLKNNKNTRVINALFDDALDLELADTNKTFDLAYIDGHHEKVATIHYFNRLLPHLTPGALVLFDDVSWSLDMREAWDELSKRVEFSHSVDFGVVGACIIKDTDTPPNSPPQYWNLQPIVGKCKIGNPQGWKQ